MRFYGLTMVHVNVGLTNHGQLIHIISCKHKESHIPCVQMYVIHFVNLSDYIFVINRFLIDYVVITIVLCLIGITRL